VTSEDALTQQIVQWREAHALKRGQWALQTKSRKISGPSRFPSPNYRQNAQFYKN
jgi:hypothetical protein